MDRIRLDIDKGRIPLSVFLDLSKAFDTLDHSILLKNLNFYGISGIPLQWFSSYLMNRQQLVDYDGTFSSVTILNTGVPQGSILGPLLFIIYIFDIHEASENFMLYYMLTTPVYLAHCVLLMFLWTATTLTNTYSRRISITNLEKSKSGLISTSCN